MAARRAALSRALSVAPRADGGDGRCGYMKRAYDEVEDDRTTRSPRPRRPATGSRIGVALSAEVACFDKEANNA